MKRVDTNLTELKADVGAFYKPDQHHFIVMNAVELNECTEVQWFFCDYAPPYEITVFCVQVQPSDEVPSIKGIIPSAWVAEAELADLLDIRIEGTTKGFVLESDSEPAPLRKTK